MIKIGINGFGRIGRIITRIILEKKNIKVVAVNDIDNDLKNFAYLLKYDSIYGVLKKDISISKNNLIVNKNKIKFFSKKNIDKVNWKEEKVDIVIDATGVESNLKNSKKIIKSGVKKVIVTHSPKSHVDFFMIMGVNEKKYNYRSHNIISSSICDASALGPVLKEINAKWEIENGFVTTLHSMLAYQNVLDGSLKSISNPTHTWKDYSLGRNSMASLIPKNTTSINATITCLPQLKNKISGISFRVPTSIICGSDLSLKVRKNLNKEEIKNFFKEISKQKSKIFGYQTEKLVSIDHLKTDKSAIIDSNYIDVLNNNFIKMVIWYDNEWGYGNRVVYSKLYFKKVINEKSIYNRLF